MSFLRSHGVALRLPVGVIALLFMILSSCLTALPARAAPNDKVDSWRIDYRVDEQGLLHVSETLVWRFGDSSGRHGINRDLVTREPFEGGKGRQDAVYEITDIKVSGPNSSAGPQITDSCRTDKRHCTKRVRIGDPSSTVSTPTATYTVSYVVSGALRHVDDHDELYWDALGSDTPLVDSTQVEVSVPGGAQQVACYTGLAGSTQSCTSASTSGRDAMFTQTTKKSGEILTIVVAITPGLVADNQPHLEKAPLPDVLLGLMKGGVIGVVATAVMAVAVRITKRRRADEPPLPDSDTGPDDATALDSGHYQQPPGVPEMPVVLSGLLLDGKVGNPELTAELVDLAVRGIVSIGDELGDGTTRVRLVNPYLPKAPWEEQFIQVLFRGRLGKGNDVVTLDRDRLLQAGNVVLGAANQLAAERGLIKRPSRGFVRGVSPLMALLLVPLAFMGFMFTGFFSVLGEVAGEGFFIVMFGLLGLVIPLVIGGLFIRKYTNPAQLTSTGSAAAAQVRVYRDWLRAGKADQVVLDPSRDMFSELLPWAIAVGQAQGWVNICSALNVFEGRLPNWYMGDWSSFRNGLFLVSVVSDMTSTGSDFASGGGGGSFSSGGGGGFSGGSAGGGGGGGGASSW